MRLLKVFPLVLVLLLAGAGPALAHVTVTGQDAVSGGSDAVVTFRVPTESETASTTKVEVALPTDTPMASVDMLAMPGWTETQTSINLSTPIKTDDGDITSAVSRVIWTAQAGYQIKPGSFGEFVLVAGQLPDTKSLTFKVLQTYSDKKVVSWIQVPAAGQTAEDVDYPAPTLTLGAANGSGTSAAPSVLAAPVATANTTLPTVLAVVALLLAIAACVIALTGRMRRSAPAGAAGSDTAPQTQDDPLVTTGARD